VHERCKKEIEILSLPQWFFKILEHKKKFLELADKINWYPSFMKSRYIDWVEHLSWDWCLSRQRFYGIPFPAWHCKDCNEVLLAEIKDLPIDPQETLYPKGKCPACKGSNIEPDKDIMDTWNTSSLTPYILYTYYDKEAQSTFENNKIPEFIPMGMRPQAHDIIRTWAFYTIVKTWMHHKTIPWKNIVISGHVLSDNKIKLSKSKGGGPLDPEKLVERYSADAIRYWTASGGLGKDILFSESQIKIGSKLVTKLWNAFRFVHTHIEDFTIDSKPPKQLGLVNEWVLNSASKCYEDYKKYMLENEFSIALQHIERFFWAHFCDNYLELVKDQLFNPDKYEKHEIYATKFTLYKIGIRILQLYSPYVPHITEALYSQVYKIKEKYKSIHQTKFEKIQVSYNFAASDLIMQFMINIISTIRKLKTKNELSLKAELDSLEIYSTNQEMISKISNYEQLIRGITQAHIIEFKNEKLQESMLEKIGDRVKATIYIE